MAELGESSPSTDLARFRLHTWPTVLTYLCPRKVQTAYLAYCLHLPLPTCAYLCPSKVQTAYLAYCLHLLVPLPG